MKLLNTSLCMLIFGVLTCGFLAGCTSTGNNQQNNNDTPQMVSTTAYDEAKMIFYSLPSPVETIMILNNLGIRYNQEVLNPTSNVINYTTQASQAINLGVYSADLSYCALYEQNPDALKYLVSVKNLSEQLGIIGFFGDSIIERIQENMNNKNKIVTIVSEAYTKSTSFLEENSRNEIASLVIAGAWIEGFYISTQVIKSVKEESNEINDIIANQKFTLDDLIGLLNVYANDSAIQELLEQMKELKDIYEKVDSSASPEILQELNAKITNIRTKYIQ